MFGFLLRKYWMTIQNNREMFVDHRFWFPFQFKYVKINSQSNGYVKKGVIFATYSSLIGESQAKHNYHSRLKQLLHWCGKEFDGVVSFTMELLFLFPRLLNNKNNNKQDLYSAHHQASH